MAWKFNPFSGLLDFFKDDYDIVNHSSDVLLTASDMKKIHIMDSSGGERAFWLPEATSADIGKWIALLRQGKADSLIRVWANGTDVVFNSTAGGYIECGDTNHDYCGILLIVLASGVWGNPLFGVWSTH